MPSSTVFSCKAHALLVLVEHTLKSLSSPLFSDSTSEGGNVSDLVGLLIDIATMHGSLGLDKSANAIHQAARSCLSQAVGVTPALGLMASCSRCWNQERAEAVTIYHVAYPASDSLQIEAVALDLLADHLPNVPDRLHGEIAPIVERILSSIRRVVPLHPDGPLPLAAFRALRIIITTTSPGQGNALTNLVPFILISIKS